MSTHVKLEVQGPVFLPLSDSFKELPVVLIVLFQGLDLSLMQVQ